MSKLMEYIKSTFKDFRPFMYDEITTAGFSLEEAEELVKRGKLKRLYNDAYYYTELEELKDVRPDPTAYVWCKYIYRGKKRIGYYNNLTLDNRLKITTQFPIRTFVASNLICRNEERIIDRLRYIFSPPFAAVTDDNVQIQQLLDVIYRGSYRNIYKEERLSLLSFVRGNNISQAAVERFISNECQEQVQERLLTNLADSRIFLR